MKCGARLAVIGVGIAGCGTLNRRTERGGAHCPGRDGGAEGRLHLASKRSTQNAAGEKYSNGGAT
jgi:hypothetical protein